MEKQQFYSLKNIPEENELFTVVTSERGYGRTCAEQEYYFKNLTLDAAFRYAAERDGCFKTRLELLQIADYHKKSGNTSYYNLMIEDLARCCGSYFHYTSPLDVPTILYDNKQILDYLKKDGLWA